MIAQAEESGNGKAVRFPKSQRGGGVIWRKRRIHGGRVRVSISRVISSEMRVFAAHVNGEAVRWLLQERNVKV